MLSKISLYHFKNYSKRSFEFAHNVCCIYGANGMGKTNLLDAIYYLCFTKSYFSSYDNQVIQHNEQDMYVKGILDAQQIDCIIRPQLKKEIYLNENLYTKKSEHIGKFPAVMIAPDDVILINGHSDKRRRFIDIILCQLDAKYLVHLVQYNKYLAQRNAMLKASKNKVIDGTLHDHYNNELHLHASYIYKARQALIEQMKPLCKKFYAIITDTDEDICIHYQSQLHDAPLTELIQQSLEKDFATQRTNVGIHKDDILLEINNYPMKQDASQGQKKSLLFAIKLAEYSLLEKSLIRQPILLLDDIFEKLDENRSQLLVNLITQLNTQIFITDTHEERLKSFFAGVENIQFEKIN